MTRKPQLQRISRRGLISSGVLAGVLAATGMQVQARTRGGVLRLGLSGPVTSWDPRQAQGAFMRVAGQGAVYETLTDLAASGELVGELAESWEPAADARIWTVNLRGGVDFHDGRPVTAGDVAASFALHRAASPAQGIMARVAEMRVLNAQQIQFQLVAPDANFPLALSDPHLLVAPEGLFNGIGSGLYRVTDPELGERLRLERVTDHHRDGKAGWFDAVILRAMPEAARRSAALIAGQVDAVDFPADLDGIAGHRALKLWRDADCGIALFEPAPAALVGLDLVAGPPLAPLVGVDAAYAMAPASLSGPLARYGWGLENLVPAQEGALPQPVAHLPFTMAYARRLGHEGAIGNLMALDSGRIAERWWFA